MAFPASLLVQLLHVVVCAFPSRAIPGVGTGQHVVLVGSIADAIDHVAVLVDRRRLADIVPVALGVAVQFVDVRGDECPARVVPRAVSATAGGRGAGDSRPDFFEEAADRTRRASDRGTRVPPRSGRIVTADVADKRNKRGRANPAAPSMSPSTGYVNPPRGRRPARGGFKSGFSGR
jgi:hypothetical protein